MEWIDVEKELPISEDDYLVIDYNKQMYVSFASFQKMSPYSKKQPIFTEWRIRCDCIYSDGKDDISITHWMPLPKPPN